MAFMLIRVKHSQVAFLRRPPSGVSVLIELDQIATNVFFLRILTEFVVIEFFPFFRSFRAISMADFWSRDQPRSQEKFLPHIFFQGFTCSEPFVAILSSSPSRNHRVAYLKKRPQQHKIIFFLNLSLKMSRHCTSFLKSPTAKKKAI